MPAHTYRKQGVLRLTDEETKADYQRVQRKKNRALFSLSLSLSLYRFPTPQEPIFVPHILAYREDGCISIVHESTQIVILNGLKRITQLCLLSVVRDALPKCLVPPALTTRRRAALSLA